MWWQVLLGVLAGLLLIYLGLVGVLWWGYRHSPDNDSLRGAVRLLPDLVRLLRRLAADPSLPRGVRVRLLLLMGYLVSPIDLIPGYRLGNPAHAMASSPSGRCGVTVPWDHVRS